MIIEQRIQDGLKQIKESPQGHALVSYLEQAKQEMNNIKSIESWEEVLGRKFALKVIDDLFIFMEDKKVEVKSKNQYI